MLDNEPGRLEPDDLRVLENLTLSRRDVFSCGEGGAGDQKNRKDDMAHKNGGGVLISSLNCSGASMSAVFGGHRPPLQPN